MNKKFISIITLIFAIILMATSNFAHSGGTDKYGGHYIKECGKCVGYHYHKAFKDGSEDFTGWQLNLNTTIKWSKRRSALDMFKPFDPNKETALGEWIKVEFDCEGNVITPTPTDSETPTPTDTETPSPTETVTTTPTETVTTTPTDSETPTQSESTTPTPTETPDQTVTAFETTLDLSTTPNEELPQTGEGFDLFTIIWYLLAIISIGLGISLLYRNRTNN